MLVLGVIMSWRTVVISSRSKLDFKMNYMIIRKDFETTKVYIYGGESHRRTTKRVD